MGQTIVKKVIEKLKSEGIRADEAYPGGRIPDLAGPAAAVRLGKIDRAIRTTTVLTVVMSPAAGGGSLCESTALRSVTALQNMGATCVKEICRFDEMANLFYIEISAVFFGTAVENGWLAGPGYTVFMGAQPLPSVTRFTAAKQVTRDVPQLNSAPWELTLEELLPPGATEPGEPVEPFQLTVTRGNGDECFRDCRWTSVRREDTLRGICQTRTGTAAAREMIEIL